MADTNHNTQDREQKERERQRRIAENIKVVAEVDASLRDAGIDVGIITLGNTGAPDARTVELLLEWLPKVSNAAVKETIVRALSTKAARPAAARPLIHEFHVAIDEKGTGLRWAIGNALYEVATDEVFDDIVELARNDGYGRAREMLMLALGRMKNPRAQEVLIGLLQDDQVAGHVVMGLGKVGNADAIPYIQPFLSHEKTWVRSEAKTAIKRIQRREEKHANEPSRR